MNLHIIAEFCAVDKLLMDVTAIIISDKLPVLNSCNEYLED
jgi:hypothetical protein